MERKKFKKEDVIELTEANVVSIYNECLATKETPVQNIIHAKFSKSPHVPEVHFDYTKIHSNREKLKYLLGQLSYTHKFDPKNPYDLDFKPSTGCVNYKNQPWTKNQKILGLFYYLEQGARTISIFNKLNETYLDEDSEIIPTLSPRDPKFAEWSKQFIE